jgi:hypothetical protein
MNQLGLGFTVAGAACVGALALWPVLIALEVGRCEKPKYTVIKTLRKGRWGSGAVELRKYAPFLVAEVVVEGSSWRDASSKGFRKIAGFIFGKNTAVGKDTKQTVAMTSPVRMELQSDKASSEKISMTSPVAMTLSKEGDKSSDGPTGPVKMSFVMPSKYTKDTLPKPNDPDVVIKEVESRTAAALTFRGSVRGRDIVNKRRDELLALVKAEGLVPEGDVMLYQYHPPFAPSFQRVNEVLYYVQEPQQ